MSEESSKKMSRCIRCDEEVSTGRPSSGWDYVPLLYNHEKGELPICEECFEEVEERDLR